MANGKASSWLEDLVGGTDHSMADDLFKRVKERAGKSAANDAGVFTQPLPNPGPCADKATLALWFKLFARDCRAALPKAA